MEKKNLQNAEISKQNLENVTGGYNVPPKVCPRCGGSTWYTNSLNTFDDPIYIMQCADCGLVINL